MPGIGDFQQWLNLPRQRESRQVVVQGLQRLIERVALGTCGRSLALAAFGFMHMLTEEPLLKQLLRYVMADEARHVAFGVLSLKEYYAELTDNELAERQEFAFEAAVRMRDRFLQQEVWDRLGIDPKVAIPLTQASPIRSEFQKMLFAKIVPNCKKLGLLDANNAWLRRRFEELGVIQFEDWVDTEAEYEAFALAEIK